MGHLYIDDWNQSFASFYIQKHRITFEMFMSNTTWKGILEVYNENEINMYSKNLGYADRAIFKR